MHMCMNHVYLELVYTPSQRYPMMQRAVMSAPVQSPIQLATMRFALRVETFTETGVLHCSCYKMHTEVHR